MSMCTRMCARVFLQIAAALEGFQAVVVATFVRFLAGVNTSVRLQRVRRRERLLTRRILAFKRSITGVKSLMHLSKMLGFETSLHLSKQQPAGSTQFFSK